MPRTRVGVVGCGSVSTKYLPDLAASPYVEVSAVCDADEERAQQAAERYGVQDWYSDPGTMLARSDFELLINLTPMRQHAPLNLKGLRAGRHVLCEKPIATTLRDADELMEEAERQGVKLYGAPNAVISPTFAAAAQVVRSGEIGKVCAAHGRYGHGGPHEPWFYQTGGGSLFDLGVYNVMTITGLLGPARGVVALSGVAVPRRTLHGQEFVVEAEDNTMLLLDFGQGVFASIQTGFVYPVHDDRVTIELCGTGGALQWLGFDWAPHGVEVRAAGSSQWQTRAIDQQGYTWQCGGSYVAQCLAEGREPLLTARHAYHTLEVMLGALQSAQTGLRIDINSTFPLPFGNGSAQPPLPETARAPGRLR